MPMYTKILEQEDSIFKGINIALIWLIWFLQSFFMLVIMTNFLIAEITSTYERVINYQKIISFQHKADLNEECCQLMGVFSNLPEYKIIVLSTSKEAIRLEDNIIEEAVENLKR